MKHRNEAKAALRNAQAVAWVRTHTLQDLADLVNEMSGLGEDVSDISQLLNDLSEMDQSMHPDATMVPEVSEQAEIAG